MKNAILCAVALAPWAAAQPLSNGNDNFANGPEYHRITKLEEKFPSPFRSPEIRVTTQTAAPVAKPTGPNIPAVLAKFNELRLTGVIPSTPKTPGLILLGGYIFHEGDELKEYDRLARKDGPFLPEHKVVLKSVTPEALKLEVSYLKLDGAVPRDLPIELYEFRRR